MAALVRIGLRRSKAIHGVLLMAVRQCGNSYGTCACAVVTNSLLSVDLRASARFFRAHSGRRFTSIDAKPEVNYSKLVPVFRERGKMVSYNAVWLRENCRCDACFVSATGQRAVVFHRLPPEAFVANHVNWENEEGVVEVTWGDGHLSR